MKHVLLSVLVVGLLAGQAFGDMYVLDTPMAKTFLQMNIENSFTNQLYLSIDNPGTASSAINFQVDTGFKSYPPPMQLQVGFVGQLNLGETISIGTAENELPSPPTGVSYDTFGAWLANDDDDRWGASLYVKVGSTTYTSPTTEIPAGTAMFFSQPFGTGDLAEDVTEFGFLVDYKGAKNSDNFHISAVPVPAGVLLGFLGLGVAGLGLRKLS